MGTSPSPLTHSSSGAASAVGKGRKGCLFLKMPFAIQVPSRGFIQLHLTPGIKQAPDYYVLKVFPMQKAAWIRLVFSSPSPQ